MVFSPSREEENLRTDLAKIRATTRMRLGVVAGLVIIGLLQTKYPIAPDADFVTASRMIVRAVMPVIFIGVAGIVLVVGIARRDMKRVEAAYESKRFRVPKRSPSGKA